MEEKAAQGAAEAALDAAEKKQQEKAERKAAHRLKVEKLRKEWLEQLEVERLKKAAELIEHRLRGRPETIPVETLEKVIALHAEGEPIKSSCEIFDVSFSQFLRRVNASEDLREQYTRAHEDYAHARVSDMHALARREPDVERARLIADISKWEVSKVLPTMYGDRLKVEAPDGVAFSINIGQVPEKKEESGG